jgi:hypothetical protein
MVCVHMLLVVNVVIHVCVRAAGILPRLSEAGCCGERILAMDPECLFVGFTIGSGGRQAGAARDTIWVCVLPAV